MPKTVLVSPPWTYGALGARVPRRGGRDVTGQGVLPSLAIHWLATTLELNGIEAIAIEGYGRTAAEMADEIASHAPDVVGITVMSCLWPSSRKLIQLLRTRLPEVRIAIGGPHATLNGANLFEVQGAPDAIFQGASEKAFLQWIQQGMDEGIFGRDKGRPIHSAGWSTRMAARVPWSMCIPNILFLRDPPFATSVTTLGCARPCSSCRLGIGRLARSAEEVHEEMLFMGESLGVRSLAFMDDMTLFDHPSDEVELVLKDLADRRSPVKFSLYVDRFDLEPEWLELLHRAGCWRMMLLLESGVPHIRNYAKGRDISAEQIIRTVQDVHASGIEPAGRFEFGFPGETWEDGLETIRFAKDLPLTVSSFIRSMAQPRSRLALDREAEGRATKELDRWSYYGRPMEPDGMTMVQQDALVRQGVRDYYRRPRALLRSAGRGRLDKRIVRAAEIGRRVILDRTE